MSLRAIEAGLVKVNDETVMHPNAYVHLDSDIISVNGMVLHRKTVKPITVFYHKPHGTIGSREEFRITLYSHLVNKRFWYTPSGVLPKSASGIVIVSNDKRHSDVRKTTVRMMTQDLWFKVNRKVDAKELKGIQKDLEEVCPEEQSIINVSIGADNSRTMWLKVTCKHATIHQIAVVLKKHKIEILSIERRRLGPFRVEDLAAGAWRRLSDEEVVSLDELATSSRPDTTPLMEVWGEIAERIAAESAVTAVSADSAVSAVAPEEPVEPVEPEEPEEPEEN